MKYYLQDCHIKGKDFSENCAKVSVIKKYLFIYEIMTVTYEYYVQQFSKVYIQTDLMCLDQIFNLYNVITEMKSGTVRQPHIFYKSDQINVVSMPNQLSSIYLTTIILNKWFCTVVH